MAKAKSSKNFLDSTPCVESSLALCDSTQNSPISCAKNKGIKGVNGAEVPPADFLLERELLGTPPKSEKRLLLGKHLKSSWGERVRGAALLRKESSEFESEGNRRI